MRHRYHVLTGPTASGKSAFLLGCAGSRRLAVISADSRQVYRMMDIGTGKPDAAELALLPHRLIDLVDPGEKYSAHRFVIDAATAMQDLASEGFEVWVCGGTGLYIHALLEHLELGQPPRESLRLRLSELIAVDGPQHWAAELGLQLQDSHNPIRVVRAAELACDTPAHTAGIYQRLGLDPAAEVLDVNSREEFSAALAILADWQCAGIAVLDPGYDELLELIASRVRRMFEQGLPEEVQRIRDAGFGDADELANGIAYREAGMLLDGELEYEEAVQGAIIRTRQYAKRQRTYFRGRGWQFMDPDGLAGWFNSLA